MPVFDSPFFSDHEIVVFGRDDSVGLTAIIAIHSTVLGPALGGCRMLPYRSEQDAIDDVLRLSRAMSRKAALADLPQTGGKAVIIGDPDKLKKPEFLRAYGRFVHKLGGRYITSIDSGTTVPDMDIIREVTPYVAGTSEGSGDPSKATAWGVFQSMKAAIAHRYGKDRFDGLRVAVQGTGNVGAHLCHYLACGGAQLIVTDKNARSTSRVAQQTNAVVVEPEQIFESECDIFSPCALGGVLNSETIPKLKCEIVAGPANNQLKWPLDATRLNERGILYLPDFVINAGGIIDLYYEQRSKRYDQDAAFRHVSRVYKTVDEILCQSEKSGILPNDVAIEMADGKLMRAALDSDFDNSALNRGRSTNVAAAAK